MVNVIGYACFLPAVTSQNVCCEKGGKLQFSNSFESQQLSEQKTF